MTNKVRMTAPVTKTRTMGLQDLVALVSLVELAEMVITVLVFPSALVATMLWPRKFDFPTPKSDFANP